MITNRFLDLLNLLLITAIAYFAVDAGYSMVFPPLAPSLTQLDQVRATKTVNHTSHLSFSAYRTIIERDLFKTLKPAKTKQAPIDPEKMKKTDLDLKLWGTVKGGPDQSFAVIEDPKIRQGRKRQKLYQTGDTIQNAKLVKILRNRIILNVDGRNEVLDIKEFKSAKRNYRTRARGDSRHKPPIKRRRLLRRRTIENAMQNTDRVLADLRFRPHSEGLMLAGVRSSSFFRRMGLRRGDILTHFDGRRIHSIDDILNAYNSLSSASSQFSIEFIRRGRRRISQYILR